MSSKRVWLVLAICIGALCLMSAIFFCLSGSNCEKVVYGDMEKKNYIPTIKASPANGETVNLLSGGIYAVASAYEKGVAEQYFTREDSYAPESVEVAWTCEEGATGYTFLVSQSEDLEDATSVELQDTAVVLADLLAGTTYYYQIRAQYTDRVVYSKVFHFVTAQLPRTISVPRVSNTRDIGGYITEDGKYRVRQGMVYRGGTLDYASKESRQKMLNVYHIRTDLDLRKKLSASPLGEDVNFISVDCPYYSNHGKGIDAPMYRSALATAIRSFADPDNYPIYVHCEIGRDRTGTVVFLINSLLGVGQQDLLLDYELSFMSEAGCRDGQTPATMMDAYITEMIDYINYYDFSFNDEGKDTKTFAEKTESFLLDIGITEEEIQAIRAILLEEVE